METMKYIRVQRRNGFEPPDIVDGIDLSGSWMTWRLPYELPMDIECDELDRLVRSYLPGWEFIMGSPCNPDCVGDAEPDICGPCYGDLATPHYILETSFHDDFGHYQVAYFMGQGGDGRARWHRDVHKAYRFSTKPVADLMAESLDAMVVAI